MKRRALLLGLLGLTGCAVGMRAPGSGVFVEGGYSPLYYGDHIVYYDSFGRPIYYVGGNVHYVPRSYVHFGLLQRHYRVNRGPYQRWYSSRGRRLHRPSTRTRRPSRPRVRPNRRSPARPNRRSPSRGRTPSRSRGRPGGRQRAPSRGRSRR